MVVHILLRKLRQHLSVVEAENRYLRAIITQHEATIKRQNETIRRQEATIQHLQVPLKRYADAKSSKPPKFGLTYSSQRNEPPHPTQPKRKGKEKITEVCRTQAEKR